MKLCYSAQHDIVIHADGSISRCVIGWLIEKQPAYNNHVNINQCLQLCNVKSDIKNDIYSINILLYYKCLKGCKSCLDHINFEKIDNSSHLIKKINISQIINSINYLINIFPNISKIMIGSYFDSSKDINTLAKVINEIYQYYPNFKIEIYHMGLTSLNELTLSLNPNVIQNLKIIINFNAHEKIHNIYKPNTYNIIKDNIITNKYLKIEIICVLYQESIMHIPEIINELMSIDNDNIIRIEFKIDQARDRVTYNFIQKAIAFMRFNYLKRKIQLSQKIDQAFKDFFYANGEKAKYIIKTKNELDKEGHYEDKKDIY